MRSFKDYLDEVFDTPKRWRWVERDNHVARFTLDAIEFTVIIDRQGMVQFEPTGAGTVDLTGKHPGTAIKAFSTVFDILKTVRQDFDSLHFSSYTSEPSRIKFYDSMMKRAERKGWVTRVVRSFHNDRIIWEFI